MAPPPSINNNGDSGCFSVILHRLLCRNGVPTHPSSSLELDPTIAADHSKRCPEAPPQAPSKPGIVARLMGLETLPDFTKRVDPIKSVPRSRSVNFMDYLQLEIDLISRPHVHHRRVRTSVSFRDIVVPRQQDLLVLYLDELETLDQSKNGQGAAANTSTIELKQKKHHHDQKSSGIIIGGKKDQKVVSLSKLRNRPTRVNNSGRRHCSSRVKDHHANYKESDELYRNKNNVKHKQIRGRVIQEKEVVAESKFITKKRRQIRRSTSRIQKDHDRSSLVSGPDLHHDANSTTPEEMKSCLKNFSTWRDDCSSPPKPATGRERIKELRNREQKLNKAPETDYCLAVALEVYRLTEEDIINNSSPKDDDAFKLSKYEEICVNIEHRILDIIMEQLVGDLLCDE